MQTGTSSSRWIVGKQTRREISPCPNKQPRLKLGLYLAVGRKLVKSGYTYTTEPFLVALPNLDRENNAWVYNVTATPKHTQTENPPAPPEQTVERRDFEDLEGRYSAVSTKGDRHPASQGRCYLRHGDAECGK